MLNCYAESKKNSIGSICFQSLQKACQPIQCFMPSYSCTCRQVEAGFKSGGPEAWLGLISGMFFVLTRSFPALPQHRSEWESLLVLVARAGPIEGDGLFCEAGEFMAFLVEARGLRIISSPNDAYMTKKYLF